MESAVTAMKHVYGDVPITDEQMRTIKYHSYGMMGLFEEWLMNKDLITIQELAAFQYEHTPDFLKEAYDKYPFKTSDYLK